MSPGAAPADTTSGGDTAGSAAQVYTTLTGSENVFESRKRVAFDNLTGGPPLPESLKDRGAEQTAAQDPEGRCAPSHAHAVDGDGSMESASVRTSTVGAPGPSNASAMARCMGAVTNHPAQYDMRQDFPLRPVVAAKGPPPGERVTAAQREGRSPTRAAAVLFQGETGVSASGEKMFELTGRDEGAGEGDHEGGWDEMNG